MPNNKRKYNLRSKEIKSLDAKSDSSDSESDSDYSSDDDRPIDKRVKKFNKESENINKMSSKLDSDSDDDEYEDEETDDPYIEDYKDQDVNAGGLLKLLISKLEQNPREQKENIVKSWLKDINPGLRRRYGDLAGRLYDDLTSVPTRADILKSKMPFKEKKLLMERYEIMLKCMPYTTSYFDLKKAIFKTIALYEKMPETAHDLEQLIKEEENLLPIKADEPLRLKILRSDLSEYNKKVLIEKYNDIGGKFDEETSYKLKTWFNWCLGLSNKIIPLPVSLSDGNQAICKYFYEVKSYLDKELYSMNGIKERLIEILASRLTNPESKELAIGLVGSPGVGKTHLIQTYAEATKIPFKRINMGGSNDSHYFLGHGYTWEGSTPGIIAKTITTLKCKSGIIYLDEFDKIGHNSKVSDALLHMSDPVQQADFQDEYMPEMKIDLSNITFIYSFNDKNNINPVLLNRIPIIEVPGYSEKDKYQIAIKHLIPKALAKVKMGSNDVVFEEDALTYLISKIQVVDKDGIRGIKQAIVSTVEKINTLRCYCSPVSNTLEQGSALSSSTNVDKDHKFKMSYDMKNFSLPFRVKIKHFDHLGVKFEEPKKFDMYI